MSKPIKIATKAIIFDQDRVLILRKSLEERLRKGTHGWDFPGGGVEPEEPLLDSLAREVFEETGLQVKVIAPAYVYDEIQEEKHLILIKFACDQPEGKVTLSPEHEEFRWIPIDQLDQSEIPDWMKDEILRAYRVYLNFRL